MTLPQHIQDQVNQLRNSRNPAQLQRDWEKKQKRQRRVNPPELTDREILTLRRKRFARKTGEKINIIEGIPVLENGDYMIDNFFHFAWHSADKLNRPIHFAQPSYLTLAEMQGANKVWAGRDIQDKQRIEEARDDRSAVSDLYELLSHNAPERDLANSLAGEVKYASFRGSPRQRQPNFGPLTPNLFPESMIDPILEVGEVPPENRNDRKKLAKHRIAKWEKKIAIERAAIERADSEPATVAKQGAVVMDPSGPPRGQVGQPPISIEEAEKL